MKAPLPENEADRLRALARYQVLDTPSEAAFDRVTRLATRSFDVPIALVSLVDANRQWWKSCIGVLGSESERDVAFCAHAILQRDPLIVEDATLDERFSDNPFVTADPFVRFYAGAPLTSPDGYNLGTLCIVDRRPRQLSREQIETLNDLAQIVVAELELRLGYRARELFHKVCEMSPNVMYLYDQARRQHTFLGPHLIDALGYDRSRSATQLLPQIVHPEDLPRLYQHLEQLEVLKRGPIEISYRIRHADGSWHWFLAREALFAVGADGQVNQVIGIATDVTPLKATELRLEKSEALLADRVRVLEGVEQELAKRAGTDQLTGLANRRAFDERLGLLIAEAGRGRAFALVLGDVDHFKKVNDTYGHSVGDEVLVHVARTLKSNVRCTDFVARYGGEEFCVLFTDVGEAQAVRLADQLRLAIASSNGPVSITCSFGVCANNPDERPKPEALLQIADRALYTAKSQGRNRVVAGQFARKSVLMPSVKARAGAE